MRHRTKFRSDGSDRSSSIAIFEVSKWHHRVPHGFPQLKSRNALHRTNRSAFLRSFGFAFAAPLYRVIDLLDQRGIGRAEMIEIMTQRGNENREYLEVVEILRHVSTL